MLHLREALDFPLERGEDGGVVEELFVQDQEAHFPLLRVVFRTEYAARVCLAQRFRDAVAARDRDARLEARLSGTLRGRLEQRREILLIDRRRRGRFGSGVRVRHLAENVVDALPQFRWRLETIRRILLEHLPEKIRDHRRKRLELVERRRFREVLAHHLRHGAAKRRLPCEHVPERHAQGINV